MSYLILMVQLPSSSLGITPFMGIWNHTILPVTLAFNHMLDLKVIRAEKHYGHIMFLELCCTCTHNLYSCLEK